MKSKKVLSVLLFSSLLLAGCEMTDDNSNQGNNEPNNGDKSDEKFDASKIQYIVNFTGREDEVYTNLSSDPLNPSHPVIEGYGFSGWYTERTGGEKYDFSSGMKVEKLYARWYDYYSMNAINRLEKFILALDSWSGSVYKTIADVEVAIGYALSDQIMTGTYSTIYDRYGNFVKAEGYTPYYASADAAVKDSDAGKTAAEVNAANHYLTVEDSLEQTENSNGAQVNTIYSIYQYDKNHEFADSRPSDGYQKTTGIKEENIENYLGINFSSFFLGYPSILLASMKNGHEYQELDDDNFSSYEEGDYFYSKGVDPTVIDPYKDQGAEFEISFATSTVNESAGIVWTEAYATKAAVAFKDGKITHCRVVKNESVYLSNELYYTNTTDSSYDFYNGSYDRPYDGTKLDYHNFEEFTDAA